MTDVNIILTVSLAALVGMAMLVGAGLSGWRGWLALKQHELDHGPAPTATTPSAGARIEIADLKERIKKLEAIAAGVDL